MGSHISLTKFLFAMSIVISINLKPKLRGDWGTFCDMLNGNAKFVSSCSLDFPKF